VRLKLANGSAQMLITNLDPAQFPCTFLHADRSFQTFQTELPPPACHAHFSKTAVPTKTPGAAAVENLLVSSPGNPG